jgi:hypothetical protein
VPWQQIMKCATRHLAVSSSKYDCSLLLRSGGSNCSSPRHCEIVNKNFIFRNLMRYTMYSQSSNNGSLSSALYYHSLGWNYGLQVNVAELITVEWAIHLCFYIISQFNILSCWYFIELLVSSQPHLARHPHVSHLQLLSIFTIMFLIWRPCHLSATFRCHYMVTKNSFNMGFCEYGSEPSCYLKCK